MTRGDIVSAARAWLGTPYRHQAATVGAGCDCLGLVRGVWRTLFGEEPMALPNYRASWRDAQATDSLRDAAERLLERAAGEPEAGQIALFQLRSAKLPRHCGILVSPARFIHAQEGLGVVEANLTEGWRSRLFARYEFPGLTL